MKKLFNFFIDWSESLSKARAAAVLTRMGRHEEARALMLSE